VVPREEVPHRSHVSRTPAQASQTKTKVTKTEIASELDGAQYAVTTRFRLEIRRRLLFRVAGCFVPYKAITNFQVMIPTRINYIPNIPI